MKIKEIVASLDSISKQVDDPRLEKEILEITAYLTTLKVNKYYIQRYKDLSNNYLYTTEILKNKNMKGIAIHDERKKASWISVLSPELWTEISEKEVPNNLLQKIKKKLNK